MAFRYRPATSVDHPSVLALNQAEIPHVSSIGMPELAALAREAFHFGVVEELASGEVAGFILALAPGANYGSVNFQWFKARYPSFMYVDRIVVAPKFKGRGLGRGLYNDVARVAEGYAMVTCEVNTRPPNPESMEFHRKLGFRQVGSQNTDNDAKTVAMLVLDLARPGK